MKSSNLENALSALKYIKPFDREIWLRVAMALKSEFGESAYSYWDDWSQQAENYQKSSSMSTWKSCKEYGDIGIGTLYFFAGQNGWQPKEEIEVLNDPAKYQARKNKILRERELQKQERLKAQTSAAQIARAIWDEAKPATPNHSYLVNKKIWAHNLKEHNGNLLVPLYYQRKLVNIQFIKPNGEKRFIKGGLVKGAYTYIGSPSQFDWMYIAEGFATGATIHQRTKHGVICAINANNLPVIAKQVREAYPNKHIIIAADNDSHLKRNIGVEQAKKAAVIAGAEIIIPHFPQGFEGSDWNDYYNYGFGDLTYG